MDRDLLLAWAAGFFDGEGCISVTQHYRKTTYYMYVSAAQKYPQALHKFCEIVGQGRVSHYKRLDNKYGCDMWSWHVSGQLGAAALRLLLPYLVVKRQQAEIAIAFQERRLHQRDRKNRELVAAQFESDAADCIQLKSLKRQPPILIDGLASV